MDLDGISYVLIHKLLLWKEVRNIVPLKAVQWDYLCEERRTPLPQGCRLTWRMTVTLEQVSALTCDLIHTATLLLRSNESHFTPQQTPLGLAGGGMGVGTRSDSRVHDLPNKLLWRSQMYWVEFVHRSALCLRFLLMGRRDPEHRGLIRCFGKGEGVCDGDTREGGRPCCGDTQEGIRSRGFILHRLCLVSK